MGRPTHTLIIEGQDIFDSEYTTDSPINEKTGKAYGPTSKVYLEWAEDCGKKILTQNKFDLIKQMETSIRSHKIASNLLTNGMAEGVLRTKHRGLDCQIRIDWFNYEKGIVDLKTCHDLTWFESDAKRYSYIHQLAFYRSVLREAIPSLRNVFLIAVEKKEPYRCGVWMIGQGVLGIAEKENNESIAYLKTCIEKNNFPTGYESQRVFDTI